MNSINKQVVSNYNFINKRSRISLDTLKQASPLNGKTTNNSFSTKQIKRIPSECTIQLGMQPLRQRNELLIQDPGKLSKACKYAVKKLQSNDVYKRIPFIKHICDNSDFNRGLIEKTMKEGMDDTFLLFATGNKPAYLMDGVYLRKMKITSLPQGYKNVGGIILNEAKTKDVINDNYKWLKLLFNDDNLTKEDIFERVTSNDEETNPLLKHYDIENYKTMNEAITGIFLGYPPVSSIIYDVLCSEVRTKEDKSNFKSFYTDKNTFVQLLNDNKCDKLKNNEKLRNKLINTLNNYEGDFLESTSMRSNPKLRNKKTYGEDFGQKIFKDSKCIFQCKIYICEDEAEERIINEINKFVQDSEQFLH